ncbi:MAG: phosphoribosylanthranilate isomerase [Candidatus Helarchaeota archaeon]
MVKVKVCGITTEKALKIAIDADYNAIGAVINVPKSPRTITVARASEIFRKIPPFISSVAVIVPNSVNDIKYIEESINPDVIQIHGFFDEDFYINVREYVSTKIITTILLDDGGKSHNLNENPIKAAKFLKKYSNAILIDKYIPNKLGGTGTTVNWNFAKKIRVNIDHPIVLSGGLTADNVVEAIKTVEPYAIDVSSGVEKAPGIKDPDKIIKFINAIKEAN